MSRAKSPPTTLDSRRGRLNCPETKLWMQVLQRAIIDAFAEPGRDGSTVREAVEAQQWLAGGGPGLALACEAINLNTEMVQTWAADMATQGWPRARYVIWKRIAVAMLRGDKT